MKDCQPRTDTCIAMLGGRSAQPVRGVRLQRGRMAAGGRGGRGAPVNETGLPLAPGRGKGGGPGRGGGRGRGGGGGGGGRVRKPANWVWKPCKLSIPGERSGRKNRPRRPRMAPARYEGRRTRSTFLYRGAGPPGSSAVGRRLFLAPRHPPIPCCGPCSPTAAMVPAIWCWRSRKQETRTVNSCLVP
jgi:hypothetical protein